MGILDPTPFIASQKASNPFYNPLAGGGIDMVSGMRSLAEGIEKEKATDIERQLAERKVTALETQTEADRKLKETQGYRNLAEANKFDATASGDLKTLTRWEVADQTGQYMVSIGVWTPDQAVRHRSDPGWWPDTSPMEMTDETRKIFFVGGDNPAAFMGAAAYEGLSDEKKNDYIKTVIDSSSDMVATKVSQITAATLDRVENIRKEDAAVERGDYVFERDRYYDILDRKYAEDEWDRQKVAEIDNALKIVRERARLAGKAKLEWTPQQLETIKRAERSRMEDMAVKGMKNPAAPTRKELLNFEHTYGVDGIWSSEQQATARMILDGLDVPGDSMDDLRVAYTTREMFETIRKDKDGRNWSWANFVDMTKEQKLELPENVDWELLRKYFMAYANNYMPGVPLDRHLIEVILGSGKKFEKPYGIK